MREDAAFELLSDSVFYHYLDKYIFPQRYGQAIRDSDQLFVKSFFFFLFSSRVRISVIGNNQIDELRKHLVKGRRKEAPRKLSHMRFLTQLS